MASGANVIWLEALGRKDIALVGGKNASLGEMISGLSTAGILVPPGFATTAAAFRGFIEANGLRPVIDEVMADLESGTATLADAGKAIRSAVRQGTWPENIAAAIVEKYRELGDRCGTADTAVAVRSSATAEDLPDASFAGQQETFLNVSGEKALLDACRRCYASLYTDRAITYRRIKGFAHEQVALSVGVQQMIRADLGGAGVMFSIDTDSGFDRVVLINAAWGLGENVVQGSVDPDEYQVFKPLLEDDRLSPILRKSPGSIERKLIYATRGDAPTKNVPTSREERESFVLADDEILALARHAVAIERHYGQAMDMEWARDGEHGQIYIVQARPETVQSRVAAGSFRSFAVGAHGRKLLTGLAIGDAAVSGPVCLIEDASGIDRFVDGAVLVTRTTDPDWVPVMKRAAAIVTDHGGRTSHAAIVSRELGLPAIVGTGRATRALHDEQEVTVSCAEGDQGFVYEGGADVSSTDVELGSLPATQTQVMLNLANPGAAYRWWRLPIDGVGLARMEFVVGNHLRVHPMALVRFDELEAGEECERIAELTRGYADRRDYFVENLARGLSRIAAAAHPKPVIVRMSDFKTNEYANLLGGRQFEPKEENPMIGFRGASRYYSDAYRDGFALECRAIVHLRERLGFRNVRVMVPFCRTPDEADRVLDVMAGNGLRRGRDGLEIYVMCEIPSNVVLAEEFAHRFDGFSIGSNDLTQLTLGVDRDSEILAGLFNERDPAVLWMIRTVIEKAHAAGAKVGFCGQAPSNDPAFAQLLVDAGIDSISVTPDSFLSVKQHVAAAERQFSGATAA